MNLTKVLLIPATALLLVILAWIGWTESHRLKPVSLTPRLTGETEYCLTCHTDLPQISPSHPLEDFGCVRCHGGERLALEAGLAHSTLRGGGNSSDPSVVEASCGGATCHSGVADTLHDQIPRLTNSLHSTYAGAATAILAVWGVSSSDLPAGSLWSGLTQSAYPQAQAFAQNCTQCHLSAQPLPGLAYARLTGCAACHTATAFATATEHRLTTAISYQQCNTCHFRGTYHLDTLLFTPRQSSGGSRQAEVYPPDKPLAKCEYVLDCVDCHTRGEVMGNGKSYPDEAQAVNVQCQTCHGTLTAPPRTLTLSGPDELALRLAAQNPAIRLQAGDTILVTEAGEPLWNIHRLADGSFEVIGKASGQHFRLPLVMGSGCKQSADQQKAQDCYVCHNAQP